MAKPNEMLARIEAKYQRQYAAQLEQMRQRYMIQLQIALQQSSDAALMALDDSIPDLDEELAAHFHNTHIEYMNKIAHMTVVEDKDDPEMEWTKATVDKRLLQIVGEKNFKPWDERHKFDL